MSVTIIQRVQPRPTEAGNRETRMARHLLQMHIARKKDSLVTLTKT